MSRKKDVGDDVEMNLHGNEMDNVDLDPGKEKSLNPGSRTRKVNTKDREGAEAEEIYQARRSLGGHLARVSTVINQVKTSIVETREREEVREAEKNLEYIVTCIRAISLRTCLFNNLSVLSSVTVRFMTITRDV